MNKTTIKNDNNKVESFSELLKRVDCLKRILKMRKNEVMALRKRVESLEKRLNRRERELARYKDIVETFKNFRYRITGVFTDEDDKKVRKK